MVAKRFLGLFAAVAGMALSTSAGGQAAMLQLAAAPLLQCDVEAPLGGGAPGCFALASVNLGPMPGQLYWHIDRFADAASAEAARTLYGRVILALGGQVFLQTVNDDPGWAAPGGERMATIGPLQVASGPDLVARFMEETLPASGNGAALVASGPQALFVVEGSVCLETPASAREIGSNEYWIVPGAVPSSRVARGPVRVLALVVYPAGGDWAAPPTDWSASGLCPR